MSPCRFPLRPIAALRVVLVALVLLGSVLNGFAHASQCTGDIAAAAHDHDAGHAHGGDHAPAADAGGPLPDESSDRHPSSHCVLHVCAAVAQASADAQSGGFVTLALALPGDSLAPSLTPASQERPPRT